MFLLQYKNPNFDSSFKKKKYLDINYYEVCMQKNCNEAIDSVRGIASDILLFPHESGGGLGWVGVGC